MGICAGKSDREIQVFEVQLRQREIECEIMEIERS